MRRDPHCLSIQTWITLALLAALSASELRAQSITDSSHSILEIDENVIRNAGHLDGFYERLRLLKTTGSGQVNIIHIGDSHIQADFLTAVVRRKLQQQFGNAGRGLVVPARVAGTNEPNNFRSSSGSRWESKRVIHPTKPLPVGIGGITLSSTSEGAEFSLRMTDTENDYSFNALTLFYDETHSSFNFAFADSLSAEMGRISPREGSEATNFSRLTLPSPHNYVLVRTVREKPEQKMATVFGVSLENGRPGILYHAIGVNGAKYEHYLAARLFASQTTALKPNLIIISLGTNESVAYPHVRDISNQIAKLVGSLQQNNPDATFLLVTPPASFLRKVKPNPGVEKVRQQIIDYAVENGIAFWDMFKVTGGSGSAAQWRMTGLLRPDGIHFSREGYMHQGNLLFDAIMRGYENYVSDRHP